MSNPIERRVAALETLPGATRVTTPEEQEQAMVDRAARCGLTKAEVTAKFGGWPAFAYACMRGDVVDPSNPVRRSVVPVGMTASAAYLAMLDKA